MNEIVITYLISSVLIMMPIFCFIIYKIISKKHEKEIENRKKNLEKINNKNK
jgi:hypothetical protein